MQYQLLHAALRGVLVPGWILLASSWVVLAAHDGKENSDAQSVIDFERDVAPLLQSRCVECHGPTLQMSELRLDTRRAAFGAGVIESGSSDESLLILRLHDKDLGLVMPPTGELPAAEIDLLKSWIDQGAPWPEGFELASESRHSPDELQMQTLRAALRNQQDASVARMLKDKAMIHLSDRGGATPLMYAALFANLQVAEQLLQAQADPNRAADDGATALMWGARSPKIVRLLVGSGANVNARSKLGRTPLIISASYAGNHDSVQTLIEAGAEVDAQDNSKTTALIAAAATRDPGLLQLLLDAGSDVHAGTPDSDSRTALTTAAYANDLDAVERLLAHGGGENQNALNRSLISAATHGAIEMAVLLLDAGADPNALISTGSSPETPLTAAAYSDHQNSALIQLLLDRGADVGLKNTRDESPLEIARQHGETEIVRFLEQHRARVAAQRSIALLQSSGPTFYKKSGCTACHQQSAASLALGLARPRGLVIDETTASEQIKLTSIDLGSKSSRFLQRGHLGGASHRIAYLLLGMAAEGYPADETTDAAVFELAGLQLQDGSWLSDAHRPPSEYSQISATVVSARALQLYTPPAMVDEFKERISKAVKWLGSAQPQANEEHAFRLLGLEWFGGERETINNAAEALLNHQREDGGWSQLRTLESDAYATGLSLYALHIGGGVNISHAAYQRGIEYLLSTQHEDGSWHVRSRSFKFQPFFESGFPHGHDQWISAAGTGWATMALLLTINEAEERDE